MAKKLVGFRFPQEAREQVCILQTNRGENKTEVVVAAIRRLYLVYLKRKQKGKTEELVAIQEEIDVIESVCVKQPQIVKKVKNNRIVAVNNL